MAKKVRVTATFPDLAAAHAVQTATGEGGNIRVGIGRALEEIFGGPHVKGRQLKGGTIRWNLEDDRPPKSKDAGED